MFSELIAVTFLLSLALCCFDANLFVVLFQGSQILACLRELSLLHAFTDVVVHEGSLRVHQVEFVVDAREDFRDGCGVGDHAAGPHDFRQVTTWDHGGRLVVDAALEARGAPVHELDGAFGLDCGHGCIHILWHNVAAVHHAAGHVLAVPRIALHHHGCRLEDGHRDLRHGQLLMVCLLSRDNRGIGRQHEVDAGVGDQVGLELRDIHVQGAIEAQRRGQA
mmetsp:Transcript_22363/g.46064  ORF Transcript_22363/g.46064 Transcript_22363/m.46064 type:complete len:221 (-) Transcript_22363:212-874(-)